MSFAIRLARSLGENRIGVSRSVESARGQAIRCFSDDKGRVLSEEERAKETIYIQKMEKEILERKKRLAQQNPEKGSSEKNLRKRNLEFFIFSIQCVVVTRQALVETIMSMTFVLS